jgi:hypothetical protein
MMGVALLIVVLKTIAFRNKNDRYNAATFLGGGRSLFSGALILFVIAVITAPAQNLSSGTYQPSYARQSNVPVMSRAVPLSVVTTGRVQAVSFQSNDGDIWNLLERSHWLADGSSKAPRAVYIFTDPNCPYCNVLWGEARPWVNAGRVQLRYLIVGILTPSSPGKAAALLTARSPASAFSSYEGLHFPKTESAFASGNIHHPLDDTGLKPLKDIPPAAQSILDANERLLSQLGQEGLPVILWRDANGKVYMHMGLPEKGDLMRILGPLR